MNRIMVYISILQWLLSRVFDSESWNRLNPNVVIFANVAILETNQPLWQAQNYEQLPIGQTFYLSPLDSDKQALKLQKQATIPQLASIRLARNRVDWGNDNMLTIDGFNVTRQRKTSAKTSNVYTVGYWYNGIRYERLTDMLNVLERMFQYKRGQWIVKN